MDMPLTTYPVIGKTVTGPHQIHREEPMVWTVSGSMDHPTMPNRMIDGFDLYLLVKGQKYRINSTKLQQFKVNKNE